MAKCGMVFGEAISRVTGDARIMALGLIDPRRGYPSKIVLLIGLAYPFGPIDLIPNSLPVIGYLDQVTFVVGGIALAYRLMPRPTALGGGSSALPPAAGGFTPWTPTGAPVGVQGAKPPPAGGTLGKSTTKAVASKARALLLDGFAATFAVPILRLSTGVWPAPADVISFRNAFRRFTPLPPLLRALATVPAGREQLTRAMLASWLLADEAYRGRLRADLVAGETGPGNPLRVWSGPPVTFLHLEKTGGMSMIAALAAQFHPLQIDADTRRAHPPHLFCALPPFLVPRVRRTMLVWGHYDLPSIRRLGEGRFTFTMLREPRARIVSLYRYWRGQAALDLGWNGMNQPVLLAQRLDFAAFLQTRDPMVVNYIDNFYVRRLTGQYVTEDGDPLADDPDRWLQAALAALRELDFVGLTEHADSAFAQLGALLGFTAPERVQRVNVTRAQDAAETPEVRALLARLTSLDRTVYADVCQARKEAVLF